MFEGQSRARWVPLDARPSVSYEKHQAWIWQSASVNSRGPLATRSGRWACPHDGGTLHRGTHHSQRHALGLQLADPRIRTIRGHVSLIVLVERHPEELAVHVTLGLRVLVVGGIHIPDHLRASLLERAVHLFDGVTEVVPVSLRVPAPEHCHWLAAQAEATDLIQIVVHRGAGAVLVRPRVPRGRTDDDPVVLSTR